MPKAPEPKARYRTPPEQPKHFLGVMFERSFAGGNRYLFGFVGGQKLLLFPTGERSAGGDPKWNLFAQSLHPADTKLPLGDPGRVVPGRVLAFPPTQPEGFVSGLPDDPRKARRS